MQTKYMYIVYSNDELGRVFKIGTPLNINCKKSLFFLNLTPWIFPVQSLNRMRRVLFHLMYLIITKRSSVLKFKFYLHFYDK